MPNPLGLAAVATRFRVARLTLRAAVLGEAARQWDSLGGYGDTFAVVFAERFGPALEAGQTQAATLTAAMFAQAERASLGRAEPVGVSPLLVGAEAMRGVPTADLLRRPFLRVWARLAEGDDYPTAVAAGRARLGVLTDTNLQLAHTHATRHLGEERGVKGFQRIPANGACSLCRHTDHRLYKPGKLMPIHPHCHCTAMPVFRDRDADSLASVLPPAPEQSAAVSVRDHGEMGPLLRPEADRPKGAS